MHVIMTSVKKNTPPLELRKRMLALGNENSQECLVRFYDMHPNYIYRDEIKKIENMLLYFHFPFAPLLTVVGFRVYGTFENDSSEL